MFQPGQPRVSEMILVGDVGGTNVRIACAQRVDGIWKISALARLANDDFDNFDEVLAQYLESGSARPSKACFGFAGPVKVGEVTLTNRGWQTRAADLQRRFGFDDVLLINDFTAMARSVPELASDGLENVFAGVAVPDAPVLVAGPGTGLGVATLLREPGGAWRVLSGEGGHSAYAPRHAIEFEIATILMREHGYVSNELVASGSGLPAVLSAFCEVYDREMEDMTPQEMRNRADAGDEMFRRLIEVRADCVMGMVGDLVLANGALGGAVLAGGVSERIVDFLKRPAARDRFVNRGPMSAYLEHCPVQLLRYSEAPLIGAAAFFQQERMR
jgi:glucokinase